MIADRLLLIDRKYMVGWNMHLYCTLGYLVLINTAIKLILRFVINTQIEQSYLCSTVIQ